MVIKDPILVTHERQCLATQGCLTMRCNTYSESPTSIYSFFFFKHPTEYTEAETKGKKWVTLLIIIPNHMLIKILLLISGGLEVLVPKGERLLPGTHMVLHELKGEASIRPFCGFSSHWMEEGLDSIDWGGGAVLPKGSEPCLVFS